MLVRIFVALVLVFGLFTFNGCKKSTTTTPEQPSEPNSMATE